MPTAGLLERAEFEVLYWRLQEGEAPSAAAAASPKTRETVLGNCARCGSGDKLKFCSRCNTVRYCSSDCQKADVSGRAWRGFPNTSTTRGPSPDADKDSCLNNLLK